MTCLSPRPYLAFKFFNSLFAGAAMGAVFAIYALIDPAVFSAGGLLLAAGMLVVARLYSRLMNLPAFFAVTIGVEAVMLIVVALYLWQPLSPAIALSVYGGYQVMFLFGNYLIRAETLFLKRVALLSWLDVRKQTGYLLGLAASWLAYQWLEKGFFITDKSQQVWWLHWGLLATQIAVIVYAIRAFKRS
ncbi:MAG: hypothetical protein AB7E49_03260 [Campylobacterales bacterium]